ncbi:uncharacterized protein [Palaemon carinicauda]|uniref:uncharacterized protein n=1 Tax=Palaemon carinicauda TaxID=392227 RepID=UPI0035B673CB
MFPVPNYSYPPDVNDDLDIDFSQFELHPRQETSNPLYFDDETSPSGLLGNGTFSRGVRQPLPTRWSPPSPPGYPPDTQSGFHPPQQHDQPHTSFLHSGYQMGYSPYPTDSRTGNHFPQNTSDQNSFAAGGRPPSPCESISDRFTAVMLNPPDEPPRRSGVGQRDGQYYRRPPSREQPPAQDHYRPEPHPRSQYYPAPMHHPHDEHRPQPQPLDGITTMAPNRHPPPRSFPPPPPHRPGYSSPRQEFLPQYEQNGRLPPRDSSNPSDNRTAPRPPTPPAMPEPKGPAQNSPKNISNSMPNNGGPPGAIKPPGTKEESFPSGRDNAFRKTLPTNAERTAQPPIAPEHRRRSHSFRGNRSQQHQEERSRALSTPARKPPEKIRHFVPYDPKTPSTPLPDYDEEATCEYIPEPDYEDDVVRAYVPRPDYGAGEVRAYVPRPDYVNNRNQ